LRLKIHHKSAKELEVFTPELLGKKITSLGKELVIQTVRLNNFLLKNRGKSALKTFSAVGMASANDWSCYVKEDKRIKKLKGTSYELNHITIIRVRRRQGNNTAAGQKENPPGGR
jgi:hypothetical protein